MSEDQLLILYDVFSSFDLQNSVIFYFLIIFFIFFFTQSIYVTRYSVMVNYVEIYFKNLGVIIFCLSFVIFFFNYFGLIPFAVPLSAHMEFFLILAVMVFFIIVLRNFFYNSRSFIVHFIPFSCPLFLSVFLFLIEVVGLFIRPLTLALRLGANITAGHIILGMTMSTVILTPFFYFFEIFVCVIQSYIFVTLVSVYTTEHYVK